MQFCLPAPGPAPGSTSRSHWISWFCGGSSARAVLVSLVALVTGSIEPDACTFMQVSQTFTNQARAPMRTNQSQIKTSLNVTSKDDPLLASRYLIDSVEATSGPRNKFVFLVIEVSGLGVFGLDRFYIGDLVNCVLGTIKLITCGGCFVWAFVDFAAVIINACDSSTYMNTLAMHAEFEPETVAPARVVAFIGIVLASYLAIWSCWGSVFRVLVFPSATKGDRKSVV